MPLLTLLAIVMLIQPAQQASADSLLWSSNNLLLLHGSGYEVDAERQTTLTVEHASGWSFGDLFFFADLNRYHDSPQPDAYYAEFSPRLSFSKLGNTEIRFGPVSDVLLAATAEFGTGDVEGLLIGPGLDLSLPGFDFFQLNLYRRFIFNDRDGETFQLTPAWGMTIPFLGSNLVFEGYIDWNFTSDGGYQENFHFNPRLKFDIGKPMFDRANTAYLGIEYSYWSNKYGIEDSAAFNTDQNALSVFFNLRF